MYTHFLGARPRSPSTLMDRSGRVVCGTGTYPQYMGGIMGKGAYILRYIESWVWDLVGTR